MLETPSGDEDWHKEKVNASQFHVLKDLKKGLAYKVRVVAWGHDDPSGPSLRGAVG